MKEEIKGRSLRVLVVEDSPMSFALTSAMIKKITGVEPERARDGEEALEMVSKNAYDVVFMDYFMPKLTGTEATRLIRCNMSVWQQPKIVGLSGAIAPRDIQACKDAGMDHFLAKPLRLFQLEEMIGTLGLLQAEAVAV